MENFIFLCSEWQQNWKTVLYCSTIKIEFIFYFLLTVILKNSITVCKPRKNTYFFCLVIYVKEAEPVYVTLHANLCITWEKLEIQKRNARHGNLFCTIFFIYAASGLIHHGKIRVQSNPLKSYQNVKISISTSKHNISEQFDNSCSCSFYICSSRESINILVEEFNKVIL